MTLQNSQEPLYDLIGSLAADTGCYDPIYGTPFRYSEKMVYHPSHGEVEISLLHALLVVTVRRGVLM